MGENCQEKFMEKKEFCQKFIKKLAKKKPLKKNSEEMLLIP